MAIVRFALRFPHTFYVLAALIIFLGVAAIRSMPTDIFPEIRIPVVTVIWQYTGLTTPAIIELARLAEYSHRVICVTQQIDQQLLHLDSVGAHVLRLRIEIELGNRT